MPSGAALGGGKLHGGLGRGAVRGSGEELGVCFEATLVVGLKGESSPSPPHFAVVLVWTYPGSRIRSTCEVDRFLFDSPDVRGSEGPAKGNGFQGCNRVVCL